MSFFPLSKRYVISRAVCILSAALMVLLDQITKLLTVTFLQDGGEVIVINGVLRFVYVENRGAAFGSFSEQRWLFMVISSVAILLIFGYILYQKKLTLLPLASLTMIMAGGIGNMIDRIALGYVVDMIDVYLINFAVFNVADSFVTVGCFMLIFILLFDFIKSLRKEKTVE